MARADLLESVTNKPFQAKLLLRAIHRDGVLDPMRMPTLARSLRARLSQVTVPASADFSETADDDTQKWMVRLADNNAVETVLIPTDKRLSLCVSSQSGCPLACTFCATGQ